ncbi:MAG: hypothetical protein EZS28_006328, partial [Streblomastix strix]
IRYGNSIYNQQRDKPQLGYVSRTRPRVQETDYYGNKGIVLPYETYQKTIGPQLTFNQELKLNKDYQKVRQQASDKRNELVAQSRQQSYAPLMDLIGRNKDIQFKKMWSNQPSFEEWRKHKKDTDKIKYTEWKGVEEDINGDKFPEFVVRDDRGFIQSADGLRITVPIKRQRVTKYFTQNPTKEARQEKHYKAWKEEDKPADGYRHFIKHYLSPFLKERGYTVAQVYSVIGGGIWKGVIAPWVLQLGEIPDTTIDDGDEIFTIPTEQAIKQAKQKRDEKREREYEQYNNAMAKIKARKKPTFSEGKTLENARLVPYDFQGDLYDYIIENE